MALFLFGLSLHQSSADMSRLRSLTIELTGREESKQAFNLAYENKADSAPVQ
jgi:hypothetical protein